MRVYAYVYYCLTKKHAILVRHGYDSRLASLCTVRCGGGRPPRMLWGESPGRLARDLSYAHVFQCLDREVIYKGIDI